MINFLFIEFGQINQGMKCSCEPYCDNHYVLVFNALLPDLILLPPHVVRSGRRGAGGSTSE